MDIGDVGVEALGRRLFVQALFEAGDLRQAEVEVSRFERASGRLGRAEYMWYPPLWRASLALARGQMQARARARAQLEALVSELRGTNAVLLARLQQGMMALDLADPDLSGESLRDVRVTEGVDEVRALLRLCQPACGAPSSCRRPGGDHGHVRRPRLGRVHLG